VGINDMASATTHYARDNMYGRVVKEACDRLLDVDFKDQITSALQNQSKTSQAGEGVPSPDPSPTGAVGVVSGLETKRQNLAAAMAAKYAARKANGNTIG